jgi:DNA-binding NarL/FixJ family response regulator
VGSATLRLLATRQAIMLVIVEADEHSLARMDEFDALPSTVRRPRVLLVTNDYCASTVVNLTRVGDMVLPAPLAPETLLAAVHLHLASRDEIGQFARSHGLSPRETDLLRHAVLGHNNDEAAAALGCSRGTSAAHV